MIDCPFEENHPVHWLGDIEINCVLVSDKVTGVDRWKLVDLVPLLKALIFEVRKIKRTGGF